MLKSVFISTAHAYSQSKRSHMKRSAFYIIISAMIILAPRMLVAGEIIINAVGDIMLAGRLVPDNKGKGI